MDTSTIEWHHRMAALENTLRAQPRLVRQRWANRLFRIIRHKIGLRLRRVGERNDSPISSYHPSPDLDVARALFNSKLEIRISLRQAYRNQPRRIQLRSGCRLVQELFVFWWSLRTFLSLFPRSVRCAGTENSTLILRPYGLRVGEAQVPPPFTSMNLRAALVPAGTKRGRRPTQSHLRFAQFAARETVWSDTCCFRRAPGPPPFSSINSTPAFSRALRMADALANVIAVFPSTDSARWIVARLTPDSRTRSAAAQRNKARAALIWAPKIFFTGRPTSLKGYWQ